MHNLENGKFTFDTYVSNDEHSAKVEITLDLNHPEVRRLIDAAMRNKSRRAVEASGALMVQVR